MIKSICKRATLQLLAACASCIPVGAFAQDTIQSDEMLVNGYDAATQAYRLFEQKAYAEAIEQARTAVDREPRNQAYRALLAESYFANKDWLLAAETYEAAASMRSDADVSRGYLLRARVLSLLYGGDRVGAKTSLRQGLDDRDAALDQPFDWAMVAITANDDRAAQAILSDETLYPQFTLSTALDAGYSAKRAMMDERAIRFFKIALDLDDSGAQKLAEAKRFDVRREVALLSRRWVTNGQISYGDTDRGTSFLNLPSPSLSSIQGGAEIGYRVGGWRNGSPITPFARVFHTRYLAQGTSGQDATQGWIGIQHKPFSKANLVLEASKLIDLGGPALDDWSLRAAISESRGIEPEPLRRAWPMLDLYADVTHLLSSGDTFGLINIRYGHAFGGGDQSGAFVVTPFTVAQGSYESARAEKIALGAGAGVSFRKWLGGNRYMTARSSIDLTVQGRIRIGGDARAEGLYATVSFGF